MNETAPQTPDAAADLGRLAGKYLSFALGEESYGVPLLAVREIIGMQEITRIPESSDFLEGVINLRGQVIPVIDLRRRFQLPARDRTDESCIIIAEAGGNAVGMIVDRVEDVLGLTPEAIEPPPAFANAGPERFLLAMGKARDRLIILLDVEAALRIRAASCSGRG